MSAMFCAIGPSFQLTAARRRLGSNGKYWRSGTASFNSQPPGGGWGLQVAHFALCFVVSTHSRPEAAGRSRTSISVSFPGFNSQPPGGGWAKGGFFSTATKMFQLTAARRRLACPTLPT